MNTRQFTPASSPSSCIPELVTPINREPATQAPTTPIEDQLPRYGISKELAKTWNRKYNHESLPRMYEEFFYHMLIEVAGEMNSTDESFESEVESKVQRIMEEKSTQSRERFDDTADIIIGAGFKLIEDKELSKKWHRTFLSSPGIHSLEAFFSDCLPVLINELQERRKQDITRNTGKRRGEGKRSPKVNKVTPKVNKVTPKVSKATTPGTRRSARINK